MSTDERQLSTTARPYSFFMASSTDHVTGITGLAPSVQLSKNGGAFAAAAGAVTERAFGWYSLAGNATDRDTLGELLVHATGTGADPFDGKLLVVPWDPYDGAGLGLTRIDATISSRSAPGDAMNLVAGAVSAAAIATDAIDSDAIAASAVTEIQSGLATSAALATVQADTDDIQTRLPTSLSGGRMRSQVEGMDAGTVTAAAVATDAIDGDAIAASAVAEIQAGLATSAALATVQSDTDDIQTRLPASLSSGRMRSQVEGLDADTITAASIAAGSITSSEAPALANLDAAVSTRASQASVNSLSQGQAAASTTAAVGSTSTEVRTPLTQADGFYDGMYVLIVNAAGAVVRRIEEYRNTNGAIFVSPPLPFTPATSDPVVVLNNHDPMFGSIG